MDGKDYSMFIFYLAFIPVSLLLQLSSLDTELVWIGGRALEDSGYSWLDDTPFDFVRWRKGEPNNILGKIRRYSV